jgi:protocatechuate 3,4-dioxygenase beta subunit
MSDLIGRELGPYRILEQIGIGGMATVYKAHHAATDRYVAIKVLLEHISRDANVQGRFKREARIVAHLEHPHILPVYDYGEDETRLYLVMRYVEAGTLKDRMATGSMDLDEINHIINQVGGALTYAHGQGVIHRDIKPGNVLLDNDGNCYLTDFGLARMMEASVQLTVTGVGLGTPAYMSPEQGQGEKVDERSDIYALGVVLYEMVTGQVPYHAETPMAVVLQHITAPLPLPSHVNPDVHPSVERVILKAMAKNPDDRYQTVAEMVTAFDAAVQLAEAQKAVPEPAPAAEPPAPELQSDDVAAQSASVEQDVTPLLVQTPTSAATDIRDKLPAGWIRYVLGAVGGIVLLLAVVFALSRIPFRVQVSGGRVEVVQVVDQTLTAPPKPVSAAPVAPTATVEGTPTAAPPRTPRPTPEPPVTNTPNLLSGSQLLDVCQDDVCVYDYDGGSTPLRLAEAFVRFHGVSWSPDGSQIVFAACRKDQVLGDEGCHSDLYIAYRDGKDIKPLHYNPAVPMYAPAWSPSGEWIAYHKGCDVAIIQPDGAGQYTLANDCPQAIAWSPDGQRLAWVGGPADDSFSELWIINSDGTGKNLIYRASDWKLVPRVAWGPEGKSVGMTLENGVSYLVDASCGQQPDGCGETSRTEIDTVPRPWGNDFFPQWAGEEIVAPVTAGGLTPKPVLAYWPFDEDTHDASGNGYDLGQTGESLEFVEGCFGQAIHFNDDPDSYLARDQDDAVFDFGDRDYSVELWVNFDQVPSQSHEQALIEKCGAPGCGPGWGLTVLDYIPDSLRFVQDLGDEQDSPPLFNQAGQWYHIVLTREGQAARLYTNGILVAEWAARDVSGSGDPLILGRRADEGQRFPLIGALDEVTIYEGALSEDKVQAQFQRGIVCALTVVSLPPSAPEMRAFAQPILDSIADRPPDFEDSFRDPESGWPSASTASGDQWGYLDDGYSISITHSYRNPIGDPCVDVGSGSLPEPTDFVLEVDVELAFGEKGNWHMFFRNLPPRADLYESAQYLASFLPDGSFDVTRASNGTSFVLMQGEYSTPLDQRSGADRFTIVAQGSQMAIYVNGEPLWYGRDESAQGGQLALAFGACSEADTTFHVRFDNLKVWDLSDWPNFQAQATPTPSPLPMGKVDTDMGGDLAIQGHVTDSSGNPASNVSVTLHAYDQGGGWHMGKLGEWSLVTDPSGSYSFDNLFRIVEGHYEVWFNGGQEYGKVYENSGYYIEESDIISDVHTLDATVNPVTGSAFSGVIRYEDADGSIQDFYSSPDVQPAPDHYIALQRGTGDENTEYAIGADHYTIDDHRLQVNGLAGGTYYLQFFFRRSDGVLVYCTSTAFEIPPGETIDFDYTIRDCPPMTGTLPSGSIETEMGGELSIQGVVRDSSGSPASGVYVEIIVYDGGVYWEKGGSDYRQLGHWDQYTDETGSYAFNGLMAVEGGHSELLFAGGPQYGTVYEYSGYYIMESEEVGNPYLLVADNVGGTQLRTHQSDDGGDVYSLDVVVHPVTGSALSATIQYEDTDGITKDYYGKPLGPDHRVELNRGSGPESHEYTIGSVNLNSDGEGGYLDGLAGGSYYLIFETVRSDGEYFGYTSPAFEIAPGELKHVEYTIPLGP